MKKTELLARIEALEESQEIIVGLRDESFSVASRIGDIEAKVAQTHEYIKSMHKELESFAGKYSNINWQSAKFYDQHEQIEELQKKLETIQRLLPCMTPTEPKKLGQRKPSRKPAKRTR